MVLYRKYRPQKFSDLVGQENVAETLLSQLQTGKIGHGYLFAGPKGTGKTSTARIFAKAVNCDVYRSSEMVHRGKLPINEKRLTIPVYGEPCNKCSACKGITDGSYLDLIEIDAASNRGIDEIRELREKIKLSPASGRFKVYIIDEVHMLTAEAFNALLKTLEEPPAHAIFILCTTESAKLPETIISRLLRFNFRKARSEDLAKAIQRVAQAEGLKLEENAVTALARAADGSYRDALSVLDQLSAGSGKITEAKVLQTVKASNGTLIFEVVTLLVQKDLQKLIKKLEEVAQAVDVTIFGRELILFLEKVLYVKVGAELSDDEAEGSEKYQKIAQQIDYSQLQNLMRILLVAEGDMKLYPLPQISLALAICKWVGAAGFPEAAAKEETIEVTKTVSGKLVEEEKPARKSQKEESEKPKFRKGGAITLKEVEEKWSTFLGVVRPVNAHVVALLKSARPVATIGDTLYLEVFFRFHKEKLEEPKIMDLLYLKLSEVLGKHVSIRLRLADKTSRPPVAVIKSDVVDITHEDISKIAEEIFLK